MMSNGRIEVPVLVVGAGPSGLCASILLSRHGIESLTVEKHPGTSIYPRATGINIRSMEILRSLGLQDEVRRTSFKAEPRIAFSRVLTDTEPRVSPSFHPEDLDVSPAEWTSCSQRELEPILMRAAASYPQAQVLFGTELLGFEETGEGIAAQIGDRATGQLSEVRCRYMLAADGSKSSIRECLGIGMCGVGTLGHFLSIHFSSPLKHHLPHLPNFLHFVENQEVSGIFVATDGESRWVFAVPHHLDEGESSDSLTPERAAELVRKGAGVPGLEVEVVGLVPWRLEADSAECWRVGNVFLAGDAAHRMTPAGGLGLNTGIQDVHNLCWKLTAVLQGWAGPDLLDTYEIERRPVAQVNVDRSVAIVTGKVDERTGLDVDLGFSYASTAIVPDGSELPHSNDGDYKPVARPGSRAPHWWLGAARGQVSTLDLFGPRFTLLAGELDSTWSDAARAVACEMDVPVSVWRVACARGFEARAKTWTSLYGIQETGAVLIRPDGHVAWRQAEATPFSEMELRHVFSTVLSRRGETFRSPIVDNAVERAG